MQFTAAQIQNFAANFVRPVELNEQAAAEIAAQIVNKQGKVVGGAAKAEKIADKFGISMGVAKHIIEQAKEEEYKHSGGISMSASEAREQRIFTTQDSSGQKKARKK
jgi:hypothetical protein